MSVTIMDSDKLLQFWPHMYHAYCGKNATFYQIPTININCQNILVDLKVHETPFLLWYVSVVDSMCVKQKPLTHIIIHCIIYIYTHTQIVNNMQIHTYGINRSKQHTTVNY
jgi:hypothetical protein